MGSGDACKWCSDGECWTHGQIEKPEKSEKKASTKKSQGSSKGSGKRSKGNQGAGGGVNMGQLAGLLKMLGGGGGGGRKGKGKGKGACKWCQMGSCWSH